MKLEKTVDMIAIAGLIVVSIVRFRDAFAHLHGVLAWIH